MKVSKRISLLGLAGVILALVVLAKYSSGSSSSPTAQWSVQVLKVDPGDASLTASFQIAIYESLIDELNKTKRFQQVFRDGDRSAGGASNLLILKTTVQKYTPGSETTRAVTTVGGATKLTVQSQLCRPGGQVILERTVNGNVRFIGSNLKATHNLARNVAKTIKQTSLPEPSLPGQSTDKAQNAQL